VDQARFRAGFDFMRLRADVGEVDEALSDWWQEFSMADDSTREDLLQQVRQEQQIMYLFCNAKSSLRIRFLP
jgi:poly(A) polymerase